MNNYEYIKAEAISLPTGDSTQTHCPFCDNCSPYAPSLSISRVDGGLLYNCFRAVCGKKGFVGSLQSNLQGYKAEGRHFTPKIFSKETREFTEEEEELFYKKYFITKEDIEENGFKWIEGVNGIVMPLLTKEGYVFGNNTKYYDNVGKKSILYLENDVATIHYTVRKEKSTTIILVEDQLSAIRVNKYAQGVALLGTHLSDKKVEDLLKYGTKTVIMCLDPDALHKSVQWKRKYNIFFGNFIIKSLSKDPKDLTIGQLEEEIG